MHQEEETVAGEDPATESAPAPAHQRVEAWEQQKSVPEWQRAVARRLHGWAIGRELSEEEFDKGLEAASSLTFR